MEKLTPREEELMRCFWTRGPLFVRELVALWPEPKPHFNTLSTMVRGLEAKGYVGHKAYGGTYQYYPLVSEEEFSRKTLKDVYKRQVFGREAMRRYLNKTVYAQPVSYTHLFQIFAGRDIVR